MAKQMTAELNASRAAAKEISRTPPRAGTDDGPLPFLHEAAEMIARQPGPPGG